MKIAIIGYGRMGKCIEQQAKKLNVELSQIIKSTEELQQASFAKDEIAIDFAVPETFMQNLAIFAEKKVSVVVGTTGWYDDLAKVEEIVKKAEIGFFWSANYSLGVNLFWRLAGQATKLMDKMDDYDVFLHEAHHRFKLDAPSGTAITLGENILKNSSKKTQLALTSATSAPKKTDLNISVTRGGQIPGTHSVCFDSVEDSIEIVHTARSRDGFALGSVKVAQWMNGKQGVFTMDDFLADLGI